MGNSYWKRRMNAALPFFLVRCVLFAHMRMVPSLDYNLQLLVDCLLPFVLMVFRQKHAQALVIILFIFPGQYREANQDYILMLECPHFSASLLSGKKIRDTKRAAETKDGVHQTLPPRYYIARDEWPRET